MSITMSRPVTEVLNKQVANWSVLFIKLHHFHWYVTGPHFFTLHSKFEELYNEAASYVDELAERLLAKNGKPVSTMKACMQQASIQEASGGETAEQMVQSVVNDFNTLINELKEGIAAAEAADDDATADMFVGMSNSLEKHVWMLQAYLGK
ncbi:MULTISPECIES: Dps family protein [Brevibacillus]|uniref:Dps family protein n=1 Tax=Brevibacillus TaxID=55080 RepID=UPI00203B899D|nr:MULTISPECIES: Dps family protein [Brevibacillus]MCM3079376.1 DNA starvation/stationary phase protection protein [Brevibacillus invocatus]MCM3429572.1 DNA starvation/stationary phase protection protein [Brevibacillus invocatus]